MKLVSNPSTSNLTYSLEISSGDMLLYANFRNPQPYWSIRQDIRKIIQNNGQDVSIASLVGDSWRFYDKSRVVLWQMIVSNNGDTNSTWVATLGDDGYITFNNLQLRSVSDSPTKIPADSCSRPEPCNSYEICYNITGPAGCVCPSIFESSKDKCRPAIVSPCKDLKGSIELIFLKNQCITGNKGTSSTCSRSKQQIKDTSLPKLRQLDRQQANQGLDRHDK